MVQMEATDVVAAGQIICHWWRGSRGLGDINNDMIKLKQK